MSPNHFAEKKILLVRHGRTEWNDIHRFQGRTDTPLNDAGLAQAQKTAARLKDLPIDAVYTSPLTRARQTADAIGERHRVAPVIMEDLTEIYFGSWEGLSFKDHFEKKDESLLKWIADPFFNAPPGAEQWDSVRQRSERAANAILESGHKNIVIVSHGGTIKGLLSVLLGLDPHTVWKIKASNCSLTGIEIKEHETSLAFANDIMHLREITADDSLPVW